MKAAQVIAEGTVRETTVQVKKWEEDNWCVHIFRYGSLVKSVERILLDDALAIFSWIIRCEERGMDWLDGWKGSC